MQIVHGGALAFDGKQHRKELAFRLVAFIAKQSRGRMVHRADAAFRVNKDNAIRRRVENGLQFLDMIRKCLLLVVLVDRNRRFSRGGNGFNGYRCSCHRHQAQHE